MLAAGVVGLLGFVVLFLSELFLCWILDASAAAGVKLLLGIIHKIKDYDNEVNEPTQKHTYIYIYIIHNINILVTQHIYIYIYTAHHRF